MESMVKGIGIIIAAMVLSCLVNTFLMETHAMPKAAATRTGVVEAANNPSTLKPDRQDVQYGDFWMVDQVPC